MTTLGTEDRAMKDSPFSNPVIRWINYRLPIFTFLHHELHEYPTPRNLNYLWNFGSLAGLPPAAMRYTEARLSAALPMGRSYTTGVRPPSMLMAVPVT